MSGSFFAAATRQHGMFSVMSTRGMNGENVYRPGFVSEPITPLEASFDTAGMARGEPGLPRKFRWRGREFTVAEVLEQAKQYGDCAHGSGERYVRRHAYRIRTTEGQIMRVYFQRSFGRGRVTTKGRWRLQQIEATAESVQTTMIA